MSSHRHFQIESDKERLKWQNPEVILKVTGLRQGMTFVDVGCGKGFFALPAAEMVGKTGKVIGIDFDNEWLHSLEEKAHEKRLDNIQTILGRAEEIVPVKSSADIVFLSMVLHDFDDPDRVLDNAKLMLRRGGVLADLDWIGESTEVGPPAEIRFDDRKASEMIKRHGFKLLSVTKQGPYHYLILARLTA